MAELNRARRAMQVARRQQATTLRVLARGYRDTANRYRTRVRETKHEAWRRLLEGDGSENPWKVVERVAGSFRRPMLSTVRWHDAKGGEHVTRNWEDSVGKMMESGPA